MVSRLRSKLTYANVVSTLALFLVLGGGAYAATGGHFILGRSNSAGSTTRLSARTRHPGLGVTNTRSGIAISGRSRSGNAGVSAVGGSVSKGVGAVHGESRAGNGVDGYSSARVASGVYGQNTGHGFGVAGRSGSGAAVFGDTRNGWAFSANGNATQSRVANGFAKAMVYFDENDSKDPIKQCFNSQLPPSRATVGDCGFKHRDEGTYVYLIDFGFRIDDRFISVTSAVPAKGVVCAGGPRGHGETNQIDVTCYDTRNSTEVLPALWVLVY